jgi:hypothetical protein
MFDGTLAQRVRRRSRRQLEISGTVANELIDPVSKRSDLTRPYPFHGPFSGSLAPPLAESKLLPVNFIKPVDFMLTL